MNKAFLMNAGSQSSDVFPHLIGHHQKPARVEKITETLSR